MLICYLSPTCLQLHDQLLKMYWSRIIYGRYFKQYSYRYRFSHVREFVDRNGNDMEFTFAKNKKEFVEEWKTTKNFTCEPDEPDELCEEDCQEHAETVCYPLKDRSMSGQFMKCFEKLPPGTWYTNCIDAVVQCCCEGNNYM